MLEIALPQGAHEIISALRSGGCEAYLVGVCVRDILLGTVPKDWDICTNAAPDKVKSCLSRYKIIETGIKHGTVTAIVDSVPYEITTYRGEGGEYSANLYEDLSRRDFTINSIAYSESYGPIDPFDGAGDLERGVIRCAGDPSTRFKEDPLRILRALRFSSVYGFGFDAPTLDAALHCAGLLGNVAPERIRTELCKMLAGKDVLRILLDGQKIITQVIPELSPCVGFEQNNHYHCYTVYGHIAHSVASYNGDDISVKVALLLHDIGKPECYTEDENGGHFKGHAAISHRIAEGVLNRLRFDNKTKHDILELIMYHDAEIPNTQKTVKRWLNRLGGAQFRRGEEQFRRLLEVKLADIKAHSQKNREQRIAAIAGVFPTLEQVLKDEQCFSLKNMNISGADLIRLGVPEGKEIGAILRELLEEVMAGNLANTPEALTEAAKRRIGLLGSSQE